MNLDGKLKDMKRSADGSADLHIGAKALAGFESNFVKTGGEDGRFVFSVSMRRYRPFFEKTFNLHNFKMID